MVGVSIRLLSREIIAPILVSKAQAQSRGLGQGRPLISPGADPRFSGGGVRVEMGLMKRGESGKCNEFFVRLGGERRAYFHHILYRHLILV